MEGQSPAGNPQYPYQSTQWSRLVRRNTATDAAPPSPSSPSLAPIPTQLPAQIDLIPILLPQQSSYHQIQLAHYNRLIQSGRAARLQSSPLPPVLSAHHIQAVPGSRSGSSGGITTRNTKSSPRGGHGKKESPDSSKGEPPLVTQAEAAAKMPAKKLELSSQLPVRPHAQHRNSSLSHQSSSVPSTPHQHARKFSFESREPSPNAHRSHSPRSACSESNAVLPSAKQYFPRGCRFETSMAHTKRRMPYSIGGEKLEKLDPKDIKSKLSEEEEQKLSADIRQKYEELIPSPESNARREKMLQKLETLFNTQWPGHNTKVHVFGSSGNLLCTADSDVDICITTDWKPMEEVCMVADLLSKNGMKNVICVSTAKVPIVKCKDPELDLACDMNVNNPLALENTRMIKTYVQIDPRVRQLAMIVKFWTKQRIVNDAAFGGTLSSYTWICMIINFLQTRDPPVLPALHQRPYLRLPPKDGVESTFADDLNALQGFGNDNKESIGDLFFGFFKFYGHEFDYENLVISVRNGKQVSKVEKKWHVTNNNRLCVEEPFNITRNLGNTADDTSFRGLHMELRRAFDLISQGNFEECCKAYEWPAIEEKPVFERPKAGPKVILRSTSSSSRGRGGRRGNHHHNSRNGNGNRRASSGAFDNPGGYLPGMSANMSAQEAWIQRQAQAQLHNDLYATYSVLQAQENSLRLQLYAQGLHNQAYAQSQQAQQAQAQTNGGPIKQQATDRNRTNSFDQPPLTAPIRPEQMYYYPLQFQQPMYGYQTPSTNPSSPSLSAAQPDMRRSMHRSTMAHGSGVSGVQSNSSLRSQSQPASRTGPTSLSLHGMPHPGLGIYHQAAQQANGASRPSFTTDENVDSTLEGRARPVVTPPEETTAKEYVGYYVSEPSDHPPSPMRRPSAVPTMAIPAFGDLGGHYSRRRLSTEQLPQSILDRLKRPSRSPSPLGHDRSYSTGVAHSVPLHPYPSQQGISSTNLRTLNHQAPMVVNGSNTTIPVSIPNWCASVIEGSMPEDLGLSSGGMPLGSVDSLSQVSGAGSDGSADRDLSGQVMPRDVRAERVEPPMVVNGSVPIIKSDHGPASANGMAPAPIDITNGYLPTAEQLNGPLRLSPNTRNRLARQNGGMSPLDISLSHDNPREDMPHLSPVYETRTPSPTANRKFESIAERKINGAPKLTEMANGSRKLYPTNGLHPKQGPIIQKVNGHTRASKSESGAAQSWQKIGKGKKKGPVPEAKNGGDGHVQSEKPPAHQSERKGG